MLGCPQGVFDGQTQDLREGIQARSKSGTKKCNSIEWPARLLLWDSCMIAAAGYYEGVYLGGGQAYCDAQRKSCPECIYVPAGCR